MRLDYGAIKFPGSFDPNPQILVNGKSMMLRIVPRFNVTLTLAIATTASAEGDFAAFVAHYEERLGSIEIQREPITAPAGERIQFVSPLLRGAGNYPAMMLHAEPVPDVIVLTHGLTDSPYYMTAIARAFYSAGANIVMPLLPAHGLLDPDKAMEEIDLPDQWKAAKVHAVESA